MLEEVDEESESYDFPKNYKMRVKVPEKDELHRKKHIRELSYVDKKININSSFASLKNQSNAAHNYHKSNTMKFQNASFEDDQNGDSPIRIIQKEDGNSFKKSQDEESNNQINIIFKSPINQRSRKGTEDFWLGGAGSNTVLRDSSSPMEDTKMPRIGFNKTNSNNSLTKDELKFGQFGGDSFVNRLSNSPDKERIISSKSVQKWNKLTNLPATNKPIDSNNDFWVLNRVYGLERKESKLSEYDDNLVNQLWNEGGSARNAVYNFTVNENEPKFKAISRRYIDS